jgi:glycine cleavage system aminomethyltransferase T
VSLDFLAVDAPADTAIARSPMEQLAQKAGARFQTRDGWNVAVAYPSDPPADTVGWADSSHLRVLEIQANADEFDGDERLVYGTATRDSGAWWCRLTATRALVVGGDPDVPSAIDVTANLAALTIAGPLARETFARFCALDLRAHVTPVGALRPGSIARQPGILIHEAPDRYLILFGWATAEYMWSTIADAAEHLGGRPIGADQLGALDA